MRNVSDVVGRSEIAKFLLSCLQYPAEVIATRPHKDGAQKLLPRSGYAEVRCCMLLSPVVHLSKYNSAHFLIIEKLMKSYQPAASQISNPIKNFGFCGEGRKVGDSVHGSGSFDSLHDLCCRLISQAMEKLWSQVLDSRTDQFCHTGGAQLWGPWNSMDFVFTGLVSWRAKLHQTAHLCTSGPGLLLRRTKVERAADVKSEADGNIWGPASSRHASQMEN